MTNDEQLIIIQKGLSEVSEITKKIYDRLFVSNGDEALIVTIKRNTSAIGEIEGKIAAIKENCRAHKSGSWFIEKLAMAGKVAASLSALGGFLAAAGYIVYKIKGM